MPAGRAAARMLLPPPDNDWNAHIGPMTRTVANAALTTRILAGPNDRDLAHRAAAPENDLDALDRGLRWLEVAAPVREAMREAVHGFEALGCHVEEIAQGRADPRDIVETRWSSHFAGNLALHLDAWAPGMERGLVACATAFMRCSVVDHVQGKQRRLEF